MTSYTSWARRFFDDIISSPLNVCLVALICYFSYKLLKKDSGPSANSLSDSKTGSKKRRQLDQMPKRDFTLEELRFYDGVQSNGRILIAVLGQVFDVSRSFEFYGPEGPYSVFAGRDASRALGTFSVDASQFKSGHDDLADLGQSQMDQIREWEMQFKGIFIYINE